MGQFLTRFLALNGRRVPIIGEISISGSVKSLGIPADAWGCELPFIENVQGPSEPTSWRHGDTSNQNWGVTPGGPYSNVAVALGSTVPARQTYMSTSLENRRVAERRVCDDFRCLSYYELDRRRFRSCNPIVNPRVNFCGDDQEVPVTQYFC